MANGAPEQLSIPTCIGCGAMGIAGTCDTGCAEHKLALIRADALRAVATAETIILANTTVLARPAQELLDERPTAQECPAAFAAVQEHARRALRNAPEDHAVAAGLGAPAEPAVTWWCDRCGGIDAPQPCLGICVWRDVDWAHDSTYRVVRERATAARQTEQRLRSLLSVLVSTTPHPRQHARCWRAFAAQAAAALTAR